MFQPRRLQTREAEEALKDGRLNEAGELVSDDSLQQYLPAKRLLGRVVGQLAKRGQARVSLGETLSAWKDLETAMRLRTEDKQVDVLRQQLVKAVLVEAETLLVAGEYELARSCLDDLLERQPVSSQASILRQVVLKMIEAKQLARHGKLAVADTMLAEAAALRTDLTAIAERRKKYQAMANYLRKWTRKLHKALAAEAWTDVLEAAEAILDRCPEHTPARDARHQAWNAVGTKTSDDPHAHGETSLKKATRIANDGRQKMAAVNNSDMTAEDIPQRFFLWIDAVGGYLVCRHDTIVIGQPDPTGRVDVPILGDLSRHHAVIRRVGEGYLLDPLRRVRVNDMETGSATSLVDGAIIELSEGVKIRFRRPHPLSATARLEFISGHRTQPNSDGVLLFAESCVMGPSNKCHVVCPSWPHELVLFRQGEELYCRGPGSFEIDGKSQQERGGVSLHSRIAGDGFSVSLETIE